MTPKDSGKTRLKASTIKLGKHKEKSGHFNTLNAELNPICHLLALLGTHPILHIGRIKVKYIRSLNIPKIISCCQWVCPVATHKASLETHILQSLPQQQASKVLDKIQF
jgi:hypothetical protein